MSFENSASLSEGFEAAVSLFVNRETAMPSRCNPYLDNAKIDWTTFWMMGLLLPTQDKRKCSYQTQNLLQQLHLRMWVFWRPGEKTVKSSQNSQAGNFPPFSLFLKRLSPLHYVKGLSEDAKKLHVDLLYNTVFFDNILWISWAVVTFVSPLCAFLEWKLEYLRSSIHAGGVVVRICEAQRWHKKIRSGWKGEWWPLKVGSACEQVGASRSAHISRLNSVSSRCFNWRNLDQ